jgi:hypothetical protein
MRVRLDFTFVLVVLTCSGCGSQSPTPTTPTAVQQPSTPGASAAVETSSVFGRVTSEDGAPVAGAGVTMRFSRGGQFQNAQTTTDASGSYAIEFTSTPWVNPGGRWSARAEIAAEGFDWYWRSVSASGTSRQEENFRLHRLPTLSLAGGPMLTVSSDNGDCILGEGLYLPCGRARVAVPGAGLLTVSVEPVVSGSARPVQVLLCCADGNPTWGNPARIPVTRPMAIDIEVGQTGPGVPNGAVTLRTSFEPF